MGRHYHFRPGSFYRTDDRTGFPQRAERTRKQWNNLIVDENVWEPRQPQDLVKGVRDQQNVPDARPISPPQYVGPLYVQLAQDVPPLSNTAVLDSVALLSVGYSIGLIMDDGVIWYASVTAINAAASSITFVPAIPLNASSNNEMINFRTTGLAPNIFTLDVSVLDGPDLLG